MIRQNIGYGIEAFYNEKWSVVGSAKTIELARIERDENIKRFWPEYKYRIVQITKNIEFVHTVVE